MKAPANIAALNEMQYMASDPSVSAYVSASAGSGKTKVLVDRFVRLMLSGVPASSILALTFTNQAAISMYNKIANRLFEWSLMNDNALRSQLELLNEGHRSLVIARRLYSNFLAQLDKLMIQTIHGFASKLVLQQYKSEATFPKIIEFSEIVVFLKQYTKQYYEHNENGLLEVLDINQITEHVQSLYLKRTINYQPTSNISEEEIIASLHANRVLLNDEIDEIQDINLLCEILLTQDLEPRKKVKTKADKEKVGALQKQLLKCIDRLNKLKIERYSNDLYNVYLYCLARINELKAQKRWLEYDDLLIQAYSILHDDMNLLQQLDYRIDHILVDEAQDLSSLQWSIITAISDEFFCGISQKDSNRTIFIVGDYKQSIYSFQGADPTIFKSIKEYYSSIIKAAKKEMRHVEFNASFRSVNEILQRVDLVFNQSQYLLNALGVEELRHYHTKPGHGKIVVHELIESDKLKKSGWHLPTEEIDATNNTILAAKIVALIKELLASDNNRNIAANDIMIIFRKRSELSMQLSNLLKKHGVAVDDSSDKSDPNDKLIFQDLLLPIRYLIAKHDKYIKACLLKSPFFNYSDEDLDNFFALDEGLQIENYPSIDELYYSMLFRNGAIQNFISRFGESAFESIKFFLSQVENFTSNYCNDLVKFIYWFENNVKTVPTNAVGGVRIMTAHMAKGLESKVVILADAASSSSAPHQNLYLYNDTFVFCPYASMADSLCKDLAASLKDLEYQENMRLLYVALTRAEEELHIFGIANNRCKDSWYDLISRSYEPISVQAMALT